MGAPGALPFAESVSSAAEGLGSDFSCVPWQGHSCAMADACPGQALGTRRVHDGSSRGELMGGSHGVRMTLE